MSDCSSPEMSVVLVTPDRYDTIRKTLSHLRAQTVRDRLEIVLVAPSAAELGLDESEMRDFHQFRVVEVGPIKSTAKARAAGIRQASAPVVAFVEDHSYPAPGWAEALIRAHKGPWAAVGPVMVNANPRSLTSWANHLIEYSQWLDPVPGGVVDHLPGHNSSYKRELLLAYGPRLEDILEAESVLHWDLRAKGYQLYLEPAAKTFHVNFSSALSWIPLRFHGGRLFASSRARGWGLWRRWLYASAAPLIPLVRCRRILRELHKPGRQRYLLPRILPTLVAGLIADGVGEMAGYAIGAGNAMLRLSDLEFHRNRHLAKRERKAEACQ